MEVSGGPDIFQEKINALFHVFEHIQVYLDGVIFKDKNDWGDHLVELNCVLLHLTKAGLKLNAKNHSLVATNVNTLDSGSHDMVSNLWQRRWDLSPIFNLKNGMIGANNRRACQILPIYVSTTLTYSYAADKYHSIIHQIQMEGSL